MAEFYIRRLTDKNDPNGYMDPENQEARRNGIKLGPFDLLLRVIGDEALKAEHDLIRGHEDLFVGSLLGFGYIENDLQDFKKQELVVFHRENAIFHGSCKEFAIVNSCVCVPLDKQKLKEMKDKPIVLKWEKNNE